MRTRTTTAIAAALAAAMTIAACTDGNPDVADPDDMEMIAALVPFEACDDLLDYFVEHAVDMVGPYGLGGNYRYFGDDVAVDAVEEMAADDAGGDGASAPVAGEDFSATNVQEAGVDEPDVVKTDGRRIVALADGQLHVIDVTGSSPELVGRVELPGGGSQLLLEGDMALVLGYGWDYGIMMDMAMPWPGGGATSTVTMVDISGRPEVVETLAVDGNVVSARLVDGVARIALQSQPVGLEFVTPEGDGLRAEREATERNRQIIRESTIENWLPYYVWQRDGREQGEGLLLDCENVHHPESFGGLGLAAVLAVDPADGLRPAGTTAVVGAADTVYATPENFYVATQRWEDMWPGLDGARRHDEVTTALHRFSISDPDAPSYEASGEVAGRLLNQWALSEHDGHLRVATTLGDPWGPMEGPGASESAVHVLDLDLDEVGSVDGLGVGERIYSVRYAGDIGYVVTFRETDPLYTIDLSDPADPQVIGELKITGYSGYLHPIGEGLLLGVGQDADLDGRTLGTQLSVFDVSDLADPQRVDQLTVAGAHSAVEYDHRALLHWQPENLLVVPIEQWDWGWPAPFEGEGDIRPGPGKPDQPFVGAMAVRIDGDQLTEVARISHGSGRDWTPSIMRSLVANGLLYTMSHEGVLASDLDTFEDVEWIEL